MQENDLEKMSSAKWRLLCQCVKKCYCDVVTFAPPSDNVVDACRTHFHKWYDIWMVKVFYQTIMVCFSSYGFKLQHSHTANPGILTMILTVCPNVIYLVRWHIHWDWNKYTGNWTCDGKTHPLNKIIGHCMGAWLPVLFDVDPPNIKVHPLWHV